MSSGPPVTYGFGPNLAGTREFHPGTPVDEVRETPTACVVLAGDRAYKIKKPVRMEFEGFDPLEQRRLACIEELHVNRELAPEIGLRVRALVPRLGSVVLSDERARGAVEYAIEMRRFDSSRTMASLARRGLLTDQHVAAVAQRLAAFHAGASTFAPIDRVRDVRRASWRHVRELLALTSGDAARIVHACGRFTNAFLLTHGYEITARADAGFIRDGHGDLCAAHVIFDEQVAILGRLELDPRLREIDVAEDVAFLVMDLERIGDQRAADLLVQCYWDAGGELCSPELFAFYGAQRALVRAKVELLRAQELDDEAAAPARARAAELLRLAERLAWRARGPVVLVIGGPAARGEPTLAAELSRRSGFEVLSSPESAYAPDDQARLYRELGGRARDVVVDGRSVIVEAPFAHPHLRDEFAGGLRDSRALYALQYQVPRPVVAACYCAWDEVRGEAVMTVRPSAGVEHVVDRIANWLDARESAVCPPE